MSTELTNRQHARAVLALGLPLVGSHVAQFAIQVTDTVMLGWYDVTDLAALVLGGTFFFVLFIFGSGFAQAVMPVVAEAAASGNISQIRRATRMGMWLSLAFGVLAMPIFLFAEPLLQMIGQTPEVSESAAMYLRIAGLGLVPALLVMVLKSYLAALERAQIVLIVTIVAAALNVLVNYVLIFGNWGAPELGIRGAAYASVAVQVFSVLFLAAYVIRVTPEHGLFERFWRPDPEALTSLFSLGWPIGLTMLAEVGLFSASAVMMGWIGTIELAAHGIAIQLASLSFLVHLGLSNAATIRAGQALGRHDPEGLRRGAIVTVAMSVCFALIAVAIFVTIPELLVGLFVDPADPVRPELIAAGVVLLYVAALFQMADSGQVIALGLLRGLKDTRAPMIYAAFSYWIVGVPASYYLGFIAGYGGAGIWMGLVVGLTLAWATMTVRFWRRAAQIS